MLSIEVFSKQNKQYIEEATKLILDNFYLTNKDDVKEEVLRCLSEERVAFAAVIDDHLIGFIGAIPQYANTGWELHPLLVSKAYRFQGIGTLLVRAVEKEIALRGGVMIYLGSDDVEDKTTLSNTDLYQNTYTKIENIKNLSKHPYEFYEKLGYKIVGVIPDANGIGKPDIIMAKQIKK
ncbi:MAG TPA: GNAT family N-acetyltransferase [Bacilli bacterium]|mgnify:CR=1 FL=1|jgi:aminoglycoside 6'-N-acetyltransferase I|nr:GNAT family N-acetyltransferase [Acholeplasmataceae bacterium]HNZ78129.1 GNAT family N-acetyltransferase [Bacilli bacterium]HOD61195.1 GNAT family N-acetyltransferase [Bacilli bacterium]HOE07094.1 GNAT family N-acetyltransferase [Bacilli bacterium]HOH61986.1 GNAT family N-acetyltransferase [Bacilli bacterium]